MLNLCISRRFICENNSSHKTVLWTRESMWKFAPVRQTYHRKKTYLEQFQSPSLWDARRENITKMKNPKMHCSPLSKMFKTFMYVENSFMKTNYLLSTNIYNSVTTVRYPNTSVALYGIFLTKWPDNIEWHHYYNISHWNESTAMRWNEQILSTYVYHDHHLDHHHLPRPPPASTTTSSSTETYKNFKN